MLKRTSRIQRSPQAAGGLPHRWLLVLAMGLVAIAGFVSVQPPANPDNRTAGSGQVGVSYINDLAVSIGGGDLNATLSFNTSPLKNNDGSVAIGVRMAMTVTKPDASTVSYKQLTDADGRIRGQIYNSVIDQTGTYTIQVQVDGGGPSDSANFLIRERAQLDRDGQVFTGDNQTFRNAVDSAAGFDVQDAAGTSLLTVDTVAGQVEVVDLVATGTVTAAGFTGDGSALTGVDADTLGGQAGSYYLDLANATGTLDDARLSGNVTLQGNTFNGANQLVQLDGSGALPALNGAALTNVDADTLNGQAGSFYQDADNINAGTLDDGRLSANVALLNAANDFTQPQTISANGGKTTLQLSNTGTNTGITIGGDTNLYRRSANILQTDDRILAERAVDTDIAFDARISADNAPRFQAQAGGKLLFGDGAVAADTNLYRSAANTLTTDDALTVSGAITGSSTITGTTLNGTTGINSGAGAGTQRIDASGNLVNVGNITFASGDKTFQFGDGAVLNFSDGTNNLLRAKDLSTNFGLAADAGAFIDRNSTMQQEFNTSRTTITADAALTQGGGLGDGGGWNGYEGGTTASCTFSTVNSGTNGYVNINPGSTNSGCLLTPDTLTINTPNRQFNVANLPVVLMKIRPSVLPGSNQHISAGLVDVTDGSTTANIGNRIAFTTSSTNQWRFGTGNTGGSSLTCGAETVVANAWALLKIEVRTASAIDFYIDTDVSDGISFTLCGTRTTDIPTGNLAPQVMYANPLAAAGTLDVDFIRAWQDDQPDDPAQVPVPPSDPADISQDDLSRSSSISQMFPSDDLDLEPGTLVSLDTGADKAVVKPTEREADENVVGIVVNDSGLALNNGSFQGIRVATDGRAKAKVSGEAIAIGDYMTSSAKRGFAEKTDGPGYVLGRALERFDGRGEATITVSIDPGRNAGYGQVVVGSQDDFVAAIAIALGIQNMAIIAGVLLFRRFRRER